MTPPGGRRRGWGLSAGCGMVRAMETRRSAGASRGRGWLLLVALGCGCGEEPRRFTGDAAAPAADRVVVGDASADVMDADPLDAGLDAGLDGGRDGALDASADAGDVRRDVFVESAVLGCRTSADCPSPDLYCNGPGCDAVGFCVPRRPASTCAMGDASAGDLVCGCDGMTYGSLCQLQVDGVRLARFGMCPRD